MNALVKASLLLHPAGGDERTFWSALREPAEEGAAWDFEAWDSILELARLKGVAALDAHGNFAGPFGYALLVRFRWLRDARARGLTPIQAEREFCARIDFDREKERKRQHDMALARAREADAAKPAARRRSAEADL